MMYGQYTDSIARKQELPGLIARGQRVPARLSGEPVSETGRFSYVGAHRLVRYSYTVDGRAYSGSAHMYSGERPDSITVVIDPQNPAVHRVDGALDPSAVNRQRLLWLGVFGVGLRLVFLFARPLEWLSNPEWPARR